MGVSIYVMPLGRYLTRRFKTTWESRSELAGGLPGIRITPDGVQGGAPESVGFNDDEAGAWIDRFTRSLKQRWIDFVWEGDGDAVMASTMSYSSFGRLADLAGQFAGKARFHHVVAALSPFWVPARFPRPLEVADPAGGEDPLRILSSVECREELQRLKSLLEEDGRAEEIRSLAPGSILHGPLAEFESDRFIVGNVLQAAVLSVERGMPVIVEG